jgi:starch phosphorylase
MVAVEIEIEKQPVWIRPWLYIHTCPHGHKIPVLLLDTQLDQNAEADRAVTHYLYGGDETYRLKQEIILGIGGIRTLRALGFDIHTYHLNEGHAALLTLDLLNRARVAPEEMAPGEPPYDVAMSGHGAYSRPIHRSKPATTDFVTICSSSSCPGLSRSML